MGVCFYIAEPPGGICQQKLTFTEEPDTVSDRSMVGYGIGIRLIPGRNKLTFTEEPDTVSDRSMVGYGIGIRPIPVRYKLTFTEEKKHAEV
ncbi:MAG: hypothetical protein IJ600_00625 [Lachnospiraceae bacterium]|nr:hypothetical protein [Lachnospiraceae bacterium]